MEIVFALVVSIGIIRVAIKALSFIESNKHEKFYGHRKDELDPGQVRSYLESVATEERILQDRLAYDRMKIEAFQDAKIWEEKERKLVRSLEKWTSDIWHEVPDVLEKAHRAQRECIDLEEGLALTTRELQKLADLQDECSSELALSAVGRFDALKEFCLYLPNGKDERSKLDFVEREELRFEKIFFQLRKLETDFAAASVLGTHQRQNLNRKLRTLRDACLMAIGERKVELDRRSAEVKNLITSAHSTVPVPKWVQNVPLNTRPWHFLLPTQEPKLEFLSAAQKQVDVATELSNHLSLTIRLEIEQRFRDGTVFE